MASGPDDWREAVREQFNKGADVIKIASHFSRGEVTAAVEEAHALGVRVTCDCETFYIDWAVEAGVDMIEHPLPRTQEVIDKLAALDCDPIEGMARIAMDDTNTPELRGRMYGELAQYIAPKRKAVEFAAENDGKMEFSWMSGE